MGKYIPPTAKEIHACGIGCMDGVSFKGKRYDEAMDIARGEFADVRHEPHYYRMGYFFSHRAKIIASTVAGVLAAQGFI